MKNKTDFLYCPLEIEIVDYLNNHEIQLSDYTSILDKEDIKLLEKWCLLDSTLIAITPMESDAETNFLDVLYTMTSGKDRYEQLKNKLE